MEQTRHTLSLQDRVRLIRIQTFLRHTAGNVANALIAATFIATALHIGGVADVVVGLWSLAILTAAALVQLNERRVSRVGVTIANCDRVLRIRLSISTVIVSLYGCAVFLLPPSVGVDVLLVLFLVLTSVVTVSSIGFAIMPIYYLIATGVCILPLIAYFTNRYLVGQESFFLLLASMAVAWSLVVVRRALLLSHTVVEAIVNNERLLDEMSERRQVEAQLIAAKQTAENASTAKTSFLAAASHDLRQPIQAINLFVDALGRSTLNQEQEKIYRYLALSVRSLDELLNALLDISKLDAGVIKPRLEAVGAEDLLSRIEAEFAPIMLSRNLRFKISFPFQGIALLTDLHLTLGILRNIVANAVKYTEHGGILIGARRRDGRGLIQVWDTGIGIAPELQGKVFEDFFQIHNPGRDKSRGLGLGLASVRRAARLLAGEVKCHSRPERGSLFEISLPLAPLGAVGSSAVLMRDAQVPRLENLSRCQGWRVVVIEDDQLVARAIEVALTRVGMEVTVFGLAETALAWPDIKTFDFYISDFRLPGEMNGVDLLDAIQQDAAGPIRAVLLTGETAPNQIDVAKSTRWEVLFKPVDLSKLLSAIVRT